MKCIDKIELEQFIKGKLPAERLIEIDQHVCGCAECKTALSDLSARKKLGIEIGAALLGVYDCPEYDELSQYADDALDAERKAAMSSHINICELCSRDLARISEMRSHAAMRETITLRPTGRANTSGAWVIAWRRLLTGVSIGAAAAILAVSFGRMSQAPKTPTIVATAPPTASSPGSLQPPATAHNAPQNVIAPPPGNQIANAQIAKPRYETVLKDGSYRVIKQDGKLEMAKADGTLVRTALEARIAASVEEKLRTGKIKPAKTIQMAMATIATRSGETYAASPTAPKVVSPRGKIVLSDRPSFTWSNVDLAQTYRVRVFDERGRIVLDETTNANKFTPTSSLERGHVYAWRVGVRFSESDAWAESAPVKFEVLSAADFASIKRTERLMPGSHLTLGVVYESLGLYDEASREYRALAKSNPRSPLARKLLL